MKVSTKAIRFLETLAIPEGPKAGDLIKLAPFQKKFVKGALADGVNVAVLSIGRGNISLTWSKPIGDIDKFLPIISAKRESDLFKVGKGL